VLKLRRYCPVLRTGISGKGPRAYRLLPRHVEMPSRDHGSRNFTAMVQSVKVGLKKQVSSSSTWYRAFRSFVDSHGKTFEDHLRRLVSSVAVIPESTAECERGFSATNLLLTSRRSSLHVTTLSSLLFLKTAGPSLLRLRNDLYCVEWGVKLYSLTQGHLWSSSSHCSAWRVGLLKCITQLLISAGRLVYLTL